MRLSYSTPLSAVLTMECEHVNTCGHCKKASLQEKGHQYNQRSNPLHFTHTLQLVIKCTLYLEAPFQRCLLAFTLNSFVVHHALLSLPVFNPAAYHFLTLHHLL